MKAVFLQIVRLKDISLDKHLIISKVIRDEKPLVPNGSLVLKPNDIIVWSGEEYFDPNGARPHRILR